MIAQNKKVKKGFKFSLRYKVAGPVLLFVLASFYVLFSTTFRFVRKFVIETNEQQLYSTAEVFTESMKVPLILGNNEVLEATLGWMAGREDVLEVRVEDSMGKVRESSNPGLLKMPDIENWDNFTGIKRVKAGNYVAAVPIEIGERRLGRLIIIFAHMDIEKDLHQIFIERLILAIVLAVVLALMTSGVTWVALRPLYKLKKAVQQILSGNLEARAQISSFDEIEDLGNAFNEMVSRLGRSLENLRIRSQALEESEAKYRLIVDNASDVIFALTLQGGVVFLNEGFSGYRREELLDGGLDLFKKMHDKETLEKFEAAIAQVVESKESVTHLATTHMHRELQAEIFYLTNLTPLIDHSGNVKLIQGVMRDVTELRRIELMKESLIRDVAHELKTPTAKFEMAVNFFERELKLHPELEKYRDLIEMLKNNTDRLMRTITSIMDLSKLESGIQKIEKEALDLNDLLAQVTEDMTPLCEKKALKLTSDFSKEPCLVQGDRDMLYRLFVNLISNAIKYSEKGTIEVSTKKEDDSVLVSVKDEGLGIDEKDLRTIFDRFVQKTAASEGIGVGLTISKDIAILHGAKIWADSKGVGKGAIFRVRF